VVKRIVRVSSRLTTLGRLCTVRPNLALNVAPLFHYVSSSRRRNFKASCVFSYFLYCLLVNYDSCAIVRSVRMFDDMSSAVRHYLLPRAMTLPEPPIPPKRVSLVTIKIRYLIEQLVNVEVKVL
jgi:hypothetical protein